MWESNPPCRFVAGNTGFEVQEGHQNPMHSQMFEIFVILPPFYRHSQALNFAVYISVIWHVCRSCTAYLFLLSLYITSPAFGNGAVIDGFRDKNAQAFDNRREL